MLSSYQGSPCAVTLARVRGEQDVGKEVQGRDWMATESEGHGRFIPRARPPGHVEALQQGQILENRTRQSLQDHVLVLVGNGLNRKFRLPQHREL